MKRFLLVLISLSVALHVSAQGMHWNPDISLYADNMSVVAEIRIDGVVQTSPDIEIGAFCGDEVRGSRRVEYRGVPFDKYVAFLTVYGESNDKITFRLYDHLTETELAVTASELLTFVPNGTIGDLINPRVFNFANDEIPYTFFGSGSWTLPSNWKGHDGSVLAELPDFTDEDVVIDGMAFIPNGETVIVKSLTINLGKVLEINRGASIEVSGEISNNDDESSLVLNDGGQIFQNNENVKATFRKSIVNPSGWNGRQKDGWQLISSPVVGAAVEDFIPENGDYDLYIWDNDNVMEDEDETEIPWVNYKVHCDDEYYEDYFATCFAENMGYLVSYENQNHADFKGELNVSTEFEIELNYSKYNVSSMKT